MRSSFGIGTLVLRTKKFLEEEKERLSAEVEFLKDKMKPNASI